jgi:hypothetical protein
MLPNSSGRPVTLRQLMTQVEKCARDFASHLDTTVGPRLADFRELSRPVRRRSSYPTFIALRNALERIQQASDETDSLTAYLEKELRLIKERVSAERFRI